MADIVITTDFSQVNQLNDTLKSTGNLFTRVVDSLLREESRAKRVTKALAKTTEENLSIIERAEAIVADKVQVAAEKREKARQREADRAEKEAKRIAAAAEKAAKAEAKLAEEIASNQAKSAQQSTAGLNQRLGVTGSSAMNSGAGFGALDQQIERLRLKYDQIYASSQLYEKSLKELNQAEMLGVLSIKQHEAALESLNAEYQAFQNGVSQAGNRFAQHVNQTSDGMSKFGVAAQQTGYQVSDFIVQVQSGTNPLVAFSQQATQLAGLLYLLPPSMQAARIGMAGFSISMATATAGLTILIPLLAMLAMSFVSSSEKTKEAADKEKNAYDQLTESLKKYASAKEAAAKGITEDQQTAADKLKEASDKIIAAKKDLQSAQTAADLALSSGGAASAGVGFGAWFNISEATKGVTLSLEEQVEVYKTIGQLRDKMLDSYAQESQNLAYTNQLELAKLLNGEKSVEYKRLVAEEERRSYEDSLRSLDVSEGYVQALLYQYDQMVKNGEQAVKANEEAEKLKTRAAETLSVMVDIAKVNLSSAFTNAMPAAQSLLTTMTNLYNKAVGIAYISSNSPGGKSYLANQYALYGQGKEMGKQTVAEAGSLYTPFPIPEEPKSSGSSAKRETQLRKEISLTKELTQAEKDRQTIVRSMESSLENGFMSMVDGTKSVKDAFKSMARDIIKELYRVLVVQRMVGAIAGAVNMFSLPSGPSTGSFGLPDFRASGGSIMPGKPYVVGEHGPELVVPRHSGTVKNANQTANALGGNGSGNVTVQNNITVTGSDAAMVRAEVAKMIPQITNATKAAVIDAKQRGGQMAAAFR